jgi:hypothetical protein
MLEARPVRGFFTARREPFSVELAIGTLERRRDAGRIVVVDAEPAARAFQQSAADSVAKTLGRSD